MAEEKVNYTDVVDVIVETDKYFKDAIDWYFLKYYNIIVERTFFILLSIFSFTILIFLYITINNILPLKEEFPVLVRQEDSVNYIPKISKIKPDNIDYTSSEAILRLLLIKFTREIFTHDYSAGDIEVLNTKLKKIRQITSDDLFFVLKSDFNKLAEKMFNKNMKQVVILKNFNFVENSITEADNNKNIFSSVKNYFKTKIITKAMLEYVVELYVGSDIYSKEEKTIELTFKYNPVIYNPIRNEFSKPNLVITNYEIISQNKIEEEKGKENLSNEELKKETTNNIINNEEIMKNNEEVKNER